MRPVCFIEEIRSNATGADTGDSDLVFEVEVLCDSSCQADDTFDAISATDSLILRGQLTMLSSRVHWAKGTRIKSSTTARHNKRLGPIPITLLTQPEIMLRQIRRANNRLQININTQLIRFRRWSLSLVFLIKVPAFDDSGVGEYKVETAFFFVHGFEDGGEGGVGGYVCFVEVGAF